MLVNYVDTLVDGMDQAARRGRAVLLQNVVCVLHLLERHGI
jgi:hypothetical protein